jgi:hypothetical protein
MADVLAGGGGGWDGRWRERRGTRGLDMVRAKPIYRYENERLLNRNLT